MKSLTNKDLVKVIHMLLHMIQGAWVNTAAAVTGITGIIQGRGHAVVMHRLTKDQLVMTHMIWILVPVM